MNASFFLALGEYVIPRSLGRIIKKSLLCSQPWGIFIFSFSLSYWTHNWAQSIFDIGFVSFPFNFTIAMMYSFQKLKIAWLELRTTIVEKISIKCSTTQKGFPPPKKCQITMLSTIHIKKMYSYLHIILETEVKPPLIK